MGDLLVKNIDNEVINHLKIHADAKGCSVEELAKELLIQSSGVRETNLQKRKAFLKSAEELRHKAGPQKTDSTDLIREDRDA